MHQMTSTQEKHSFSIPARNKGNDYRIEMMKNKSLRIAVGPYILHGCGTTIELLATEEKRNGRRHLTFPQAVGVTVGEVMHILRPLRRHPGVFLLNHRVMKVLGTVKIIGIVGNGRVEVRLLDGKFFGGTHAERIK